jgi:hypothetical protein
VSAMLLTMLGYGRKTVNGFSGIDSALGETLLLDMVLIGWIHVYARYGMEWRCDIDTPWRSPPPCSLPPGHE